MRCRTSLHSALPHMDSDRDRDGEKDIDKDKHKDDEKNMELLALLMHNTFSTWISRIN